MNNIFWLDTILPEFESTDVSLLEDQLCFDRLPVAVDVDGHRPFGQRVLQATTKRFSHKRCRGIYSGQTEKLSPPCRNSSLFFGTLITGFFKFFRFFSPPSNSSLFFNLVKNPPGGGEARIYIPEKVFVKKKHMHSFRGNYLLKYSY